MAADSYEDIAVGKGDAIPSLEGKPQDLYHAKSFWTRWIFCQDAKVIGIQYSITAIGIGLVALVLSWLMRLQLAFPELVPFIGPGEYYQFVTMHGMIMVIYLLTALFLRFWKFSYSLNGRCKRYGFSLRQHGKLLGLSSSGCSFSSQFFCTRWTNRCWMDIIPASSNNIRYPRWG